jgi:hypothetical protein
MANNVSPVAAGRPAFFNPQAGWRHTGCYGLCDFLDY